MESNTRCAEHENETPPPSGDQSVGQALGMADADAILFPRFFTAYEADAHFDILHSTIAWRHETVKLYGRSIEQPRLSAWYGGKYKFSGITLEPNPWSPEPLPIRQRVEAVAAMNFNSVLLNLYRNERDSVSWHSDDERELGHNPVIASVSFGTTRRFQFKHKTDQQARVTIDLTHGSLLSMRGPTQHFWKHQIPKSSRPRMPRINLTFRVIHPIA